VCILFCLYKRTVSFTITSVDVVDEYELRTCFESVLEGQTMSAFHAGAKRYVLIN
jgi:hypothetical protein